MVLKAFSIYDSKAEAFLTPFFCPTEGVAKRAFAHQANNPEADIHRYPGDYTLFEIGSFAILDGELTPLKAIINHGLALTHLRELPSDPALDLQGGEAEPAKSTN